MSQCLSGAAVVTAAARAARQAGTALLQVATAAAPAGKARFMQGPAQLVVQAAALEAGVQQAVRAAVGASLQGPVS